MYAARQWAPHAWAQSGAVAGCALLLVTTGCSMTRKIAVGQMVPILENATEAARESTDLAFIESALPANLVLVDGLIRTNPANHDLLRVGAFLNFGYALGFVEADNPALASYYYEKGRDYGLRALERTKKFRDQRHGSLQDFEQALRALGRRDTPALAWAAANWGRWISLNLESPAAIAQQPHFEACLARLLVLDPGFEGGMPHVLRGVYDSLRPEMFGGRPDSALVHFERGFELSGRAHLLYLVLFAEHYCRQVLDEECFAKTLDEVANAPETSEPRLRLLNQIARRRAEALRARQAELF